MILGGGPAAVAVCLVGRGIDLKVNGGGEKQEKPKKHKQLHFDRPSAGCYAFLRRKYNNIPWVLSLFYYYIIISLYNYIIILFFMIL